MEITVDEAVANFDDLIESLVAGRVQSVVLTLDGRPAVRVDPIDADFTPLKSD